jgi:4-amino-4-deoxy-L-arabinose transferase-like glycosyltransferase
MSEPGSGPSPARALVIATALWLAASAVVLATRPLLPVDETRYLTVAWEMWLRDGWLVPTLNFAPYSQKPPLLFWLINAVWSVTGVSQIAARLVPVVVTLISLYLTVALGRVLWPSRPAAAAVAVLVLVGSFPFLVYGGLVAFDVLLTLWVLLGAIALFKVATGGGRGWWVLFAVALGFGILAKGPVAVLHLLPVALLAPLWAGGAPGRSWLGWYGALVIAFLGGAAIGLGWAIPAAEAGGPDYANAILWRQTAGRVASAFAHPRPWWFYVASLPLLAAPWFFWRRGWQALLRARGGVPDPGLRFIACWVISGFILFSLVSGKQLHYLIPLFPGAALALGRLVAARRAARAGLADRLLVMAPALLVGAALLFAALAAPAIAGWFPAARLPPWLGAIDPWLGGVLIGAIGAVFWLLRRDRHGDVVAVAVVSVVAFAIVHYQAALVVFQRYDLQPVSSLLARNQDRPIALTRGYHGEYGFLGRLTVPLIEITQPEVAGWLAANPDGLVVLRYRTPPLLPNAELVLQRPYRGQTMAVWRLRR